MLEPPFWSRVLTVSGRWPRSLCCVFVPCSIWAPIYITGFTLSCFLLAFVISRPPACDQALHHFLYVSAAVLFFFMLAFAARDVWEQRRM